MWHLRSRLRKDDKVKDDKGEFGGDRFSLTCREWTGPHDLWKQRKLIVLDDFFFTTHSTNIQYVSECPDHS